MVDSGGGRGCDCCAARRPRPRASLQVLQARPLWPPVKGAFGRSHSHHPQTKMIGRRSILPRVESGAPRNSPAPATPPEEGRKGRTWGRPRPLGRPAAQQQTTSVLTAAMLVYALGAGITAAAGTRLALQLILIAVFGLHPFQVPLVKNTSGIAAVRRCLTLGFCIGQFARLLPTLVVVAVSQAPSPESNPDSPLPVKATVVHYTTVQADRSEVLVIKQGAAHPRKGARRHAESASAAVPGKGPA